MVSAWSIYDLRRARGIGIPAWVICAQLAWLRTDVLSVKSVTVLQSHISNTGFPKGTINVVLTLDKVAEVGEALCKSKAIRKLSFTGSTRVGKLLARQCSNNLTKLSLELGGNSPFIVFDDAKVETAVEACVLAKFRNSGQTCVTANRIFVQEGIYDRFAEALTDKVKTLKVGNGITDGVFIGPLTHERAVGKALSHIEGRLSARRVLQVLLTFSSRCTITRSFSCTWREVLPTG